MHRGDLWYFLRGQETIGPVPKETIQQLLQGGRLPLETLVWHEGMEDWQAAFSLSELEISQETFSPTSIPHLPPQTSPIENSFPSHHPTFSPEENAARKPKPIPKNAIPPREPPALPLQIPLPEFAKRAPSSLGTTLSKTKPPASSQVATTLNKKQRQLFWKKIRDRIFSSLFITSIFLIVCGAMIFTNQSRFPNVLWFVWLVTIFGAYGIFPLLGIHFLDGLFRSFALLLLVPPLVLFWPVIMGNRPVQMVSPAEWIFMSFCFLYFLTMRIGLRPHASSWLDRFAFFTGTLTFSFISSMAMSNLPAQEIHGWQELLAKSNHIRLPGPIARLINKPEWGTDVGSLWLGTEKQGNHHGLESAILKQNSGTEYHLTLQTLDDIHLIAKTTLSQPSSQRKLHLQEFLGQDWPIFFSKEAMDNPDIEKASWTLLYGPQRRKVEVTSGTLRIETIQNDIWCGTLNFQLKPTAESNETTLLGSFKTQVIEIGNY